MVHEHTDISVKFRYRDSTGEVVDVIAIPACTRCNIRRGWVTWTCREREEELVANCTDVDEPYGGCTGVGTGSNLDPGDSCFTDIFTFQIRQQDVNTSIGIGLRTLIWNEMKHDVLTGANEGTFD